MSENPIYCKLYGNCLILCKVLRCSRENCESVKIVKKGWYNIYVLPNTRQILPFCIIELKSDFEKQKIHLDQNLLHQSVQHQQQSYRYLVLHAFICLYKISDSPMRVGVMENQCPFPMCNEMKNLLVHLRICNLRSKCNLKDCFSTWTLIEHWKHCPVNICQTCEPYRQHKEQKRMMMRTWSEYKRRLSK